jgi:hypothetical protein
VKRTFKRPDGTEETLEGTPEELAEYEKKLQRESAQTPKKPETLKGAPVDYTEIAKILEEAAKKIPQREPWYPDDWYRAKPIWIVPCSMCHCNPCNCRWHYPLITWTGTTAAIGVNTHDPRDPLWYKASHQVDAGGTALPGFNVTLALGNTDPKSS